MSRNLLLFFALLMWWVVPIQAQLTLSFPDFDVLEGDQIEADLLVENYNEIITIQFTTRWDPEVLEFVEVSDINIIDQQSLLLNLNDTLDGFFRFYWFDMALVGESLENGDALLKVKFNVIGEKGDTSEIAISDDPMPFLAGDAATQGSIPVARENGTVIVQIPDGIHSPVSNGKFKLYQNQPNPFQDKTSIQFDLTESEYITFTLFDLMGKKILEESRLYPAGSQFIVLEQHQLPTSGTYVYQIQAQNYLLTKKMNLVR